MRVVYHVYYVTAVPAVPNRPTRSYFGPISVSLTHTFLYIDSDHPYNKGQCNLNYCFAQFYLLSFAFTAILRVDVV